MLTIRTRSTRKDYDDFFGAETFDFEEFRGLWNEGTPLKFGVEITKNSWKAFFGKLTSSRKSEMGQEISVEIAGKGKRGDKDGVFFFNLISFVLKSGIRFEQNLEKLSQGFDKIFDAKFIDSLDGKRQTDAACAEVQKRMDFFAAKIPQAQNLESVMNGSEAGSVHIAVIDTSSTKDDFLQRLSFIANENPFPAEKIALVCTTSLLKKEKIDAFCKHAGNSAAVRFLVGTNNGLMEKLPYSARFSHSPESKDSKKKVSPIFIMPCVMFVSLLLNLVFVYQISQKKSEIDLKNEIEAMTSEIEQKNSKIDSMNKEIEAKNAEIIRLEAENADLKKTLDDIHEKSAVGSDKKAESEQVVEEAVPQKKSGADTSKKK